MRVARLVGDRSFDMVGRRTSAPATRVPRFGRPALLVGDLRPLGSSEPPSW